MNHAGIKNVSGKHRMAVLYAEEIRDALLGNGSIVAAGESLRLLLEILDEAISGKNGVSSGSAGSQQAHESPDNHRNSPKCAQCTQSPCDLIYLSDICKRRYQQS